VFKIARNLALNHKRDTRHEAFRALAERTGDALDEADGASPAVQELRVAIDQALGALQELDRDVFLLRESGGLTYEEIATTCELTVEAVRARLRRARQELRSSLDGIIRAHRERPVKLR
jgi:RNA polymerase sigma-70 factor (ECF subfamily)